MADSVGKWRKGNAPTAGNPSTGYDSCTFKWNTGSGTSHAPLTSDAFTMHNDEWTVQVNTGASTLANNMTFAILGSNNPDLDTTKWARVIYNSLPEAQITDLVFTIHVEHTSSDGHGRYNYYRLMLDPSANPGSDIVLGVNLVPGKFT